MSKTSIEWTDVTWSPLRVRVRADAAEIARAKGYTSLVQIAERTAGHPGQHCEHVSDECEHCYSETWQGRCLKANGTGLPFDRRARDLVEPYVDEKILREPLGWRKPTMAFVENQSDLFGEWVPVRHIDAAFGAMTVSEKHTFQVLTKRPEQAQIYWSDPRTPTGIIEQIRSRGIDAGAIRWPLPNVWLGVSVGRKAHLRRIDTLRRIPAAVRFVSFEPLLEDLGDLDLTGIDWAIFGGESGPGARPCDVEWIRRGVRLCRKYGVAPFIKQFGRNVVNTDPKYWQHRMRIGDTNYEYNRYIRVHLRSRKGGDMNEWPLDLRVREMPEQRGRA